MLLGLMQKPPSRIINLDGSVKKKYYKKKTYLSVPNYINSNIPQIALNQTDNKTLSLTNPNTMQLTEDQNYIIYYETWFSNTDYIDCKCSGIVENNSIYLDDPSSCIQLTLTTSNKLDITLHKATAYKVIIKSIYTYSNPKETNIKKDRTITRPVQELTNADIAKSIYYKGPSTKSVRQLFTFKEGYFAVESEALYFSKDLNTWTKCNYNITYVDGNNIRIYYYNNVYILIDSYYSYSKHVLYSQDGINWTKVLENSEGFNCGYYNNTWLMVANGKIWHSTNAINWTEETISSSFEIYQYGLTCIHFKDRWIIPGIGLWSSLNLKTWQVNNLPNQYINKFEQSYDCIIGYNKTSTTQKGAWYSTDGLNWIASELNNKGTNTEIKSIRFHKGIWICLLHNDNSTSDQLFISTDGISWEQKPFIPTTCADIDYKDNTWIIYGEQPNSSFNCIYYCSDLNLNTWKQFNFDNNIRSTDINSKFANIYDNYSIFEAYYYNIGIGKLNDSYVWEIIRHTPNYSNYHYYYSYSIGYPYHIYIPELQKINIIPGYKEV